MLQGQRNASCSYHIDPNYFDWDHKSTCSYKDTQGDEHFVPSADLIQSTFYWQSKLCDFFLLFRITFSLASKGVYQSVQCIPCMSFKIHLQEGVL